MLIWPFQEFQQSFHLNTLIRRLLIWTLTVLSANNKSDWQIEKNKQKTITTKRGHRWSRSAFGKVRFLGQ